MSGTDPQKKPGSQILNAIAYLLKGFAFLGVCYLIFQGVPRTMALYIAGCVVGFYILYYLANLYVRKRWP
jgi:putative effector of murein hydrolase LrgA (UPF0299 family)